MKKHKRFIVIGILLVIILLLVWGVSMGEKTVRSKKNAEPLGTLIQVIYNRTRGMVEGADFYIELSREDVSEEQWAEVEAVLLELYSVLEPRPAQKEKSIRNLFRNLLRKGTSGQDGGDRDDLTLVWDTGNELETVQYYWPDDSRVLILTGLLEKIAEGAEER